MRTESNWIQTYTGRQFWPTDPRVEDLDIEDIAAALGNMCRYAGHCRRFYSVAEHCVLVSQFVPRPLQLTALMHDASEAYLVDIPRPLKPSLTNYYALEERLMETISERYGLIHPLPTEVKRADTAILADERAQNMAPMAVADIDWGAMEPPLGVALRYWSPEAARAQFISAFETYTSARIEGPSR